MTLPTEPPNQPDGIKLKSPQKQTVLIEGDCKADLSETDVSKLTFLSNVKRGISLPPVLISASKTAAPKKSCLPIRTLLLLQLNGKRVVMEKSVAAPWIQLLHSVRTPPELASHRPSVGRCGGRRVVEAQRTSSLLPATAVLLSPALDGVGRDTGAV